MNRKKILSVINSTYDRLLNFVISRIVTNNELKRWIRTSKISLKKLKSEQNWIQKWKRLQDYVNVDYYRYYSQYQGENINLCPDDIVHNIITPILNPKRFISTYQDKCLFDKVLYPTFKDRVTPFTLLRNVLGSYYDIDYNPVKDSDVCRILNQSHFNKIVIKPSLDSSSGHSILFAYRKEDGNYYLNETGIKVDSSLLDNKYQRNFVVQEVVEQSDFMSQFCSTSVNTIRMLVYRSVTTNIPVVLRAFMRIGKQGALVDNIHSGGTFVGVHLDGTLCKSCVDTNTLPMNVFNGINFSQNDFHIPNYDCVKDFACGVAKAMPHLRLFSLDVMLDRNNNPLLIEYNLQAFGVRGYQFTLGPVFREYTDEIIDYCAQHKKEATRVFVSF